MEKYYISMVDNFFSGWGEAKDKTNILIIECDTIEESIIVYDNAKYRTEMSDVNAWHTAPPKFDSEKFLVQYVTKKDNYKNWFKEGMFR